MDQHATIDDERGSEVAIIGMAGRFPGAATLDAFWRNLRDGVESITFFSDEELRQAGVAEALLNNPQYIKAKGVLDDIELFDARLFGFSPREAELMDPQHRLFLECAWHALDHAGYAPRSYGGAIGLYAGAGTSNYLSNNLAASANTGSLESFQIGIGNEKDSLTTLAAYALNLTGPCCTVQSFCSSSLVAVHMACQSLLNFESDMALAGGVFVEVPQQAGYIYQEGSFASPDGHCRAFDAQAQGTPFGSGVGIVVLKRIADALADGDDILAVIKGSAVNNDGAHKASYTAPSVVGQAQVIVEALNNAEVDAETISYVEAHGTGTPLGDPIEIQALTRAFRTSTKKKGFCAIGSVKTNFGHLDRAAGIASLIKTVLALQHKQLPPSLHFHTPNPEIDFANSPFYVNTELAEWQANGTPRRAGVSAFGVGGTNAHVIVEEAPAPTASAPAQPWQLLTLAAHTPSALDTATDQLAHFLDQHPATNLADLAATLQRGRAALPQRRILLARDTADARAQLRVRDPQRRLTQHHVPPSRPVAFLLPGLGEHYLHMAAGLYRTVPLVRQYLDQAADLLAPLLTADLRAVLFPGGPADDAAPSAGDTLDLRALLRRTPAPDPAAAARLTDTRFSHPILFALEYALAQLWIRWGVRPSALFGYSLGEYVAACLAGVFSFADGLRLVAQRAALLAAQPPGALLAVALSEAAVQPLLHAELGLAAVNGPQLCVLAGTLAAGATLERELTAAGVPVQRVAAAQPFHTPLLAPVQPALVELLRALRLQPPQLPYIANVSGTWITAAEATDPAYWAAQLCAPVRCAAGLAALWALPGVVLLEVGPGQTLGSLALQHPAREALADAVVLPTLRPAYVRQRDRAFLLESLGRLWLAGVAVDWNGVWAGERRQRLALPPTPFARQRYWIDPPAALPAAPLGTLEKRADLADWFYVPSWKQTPPPVVGPDEQARSWLIFADELGIGEASAARLTAAGAQVTTVRMGGAFAQTAAQQYTLDPQAPADYQALLDQLGQAGAPPDVIVHGWSLAAPDATPDAARLARAQAQGFASLLALAQALGSLPEQPRRLCILTNNRFDVLGGEASCPEQALVHGPALVLPLEYPTLHVRSIDLALTGASLPPAQLAALVAELRSPTVAEEDAVVALRGRHRWCAQFVPLRLPPPATPHPRLRTHGVYLITGGLGGLGLALADYLARTVQARLVLVSRQGLPAPSAAEPQAQALTAQVQALTARGAQVWVARADVTDPAQMQAVFAGAVARFGPLNGVFHAAGILDDSLIQLKDPAAAARVLAPKVQGTLVLDALCRDHALDFLLLFSSLASVVGNFGQVDYAAASAFLDAFAHYSAARDATPVLTINWDAWQVIGQAAATAARLARDGQQRADTSAFARILETGILPQEGIDALERVLARAGLVQVAVSTKDLPATVAFFRRTAQTLGGAASGGAATSAQHTRPNLPTPYSAPSNETERAIAAIWQTIIGIDQVGIYDNFLELGGHSLLAIRIIAELRATFQVGVPLRLFFEARTVADLAALIEELLLAELEGLAEDQALDLIADAPRPAAIITPREYRLPNGMLIMHQNKAETDHFYEDIFEHHVYAKNGITLDDDACVFDVGANIGLFTLFVQQRCKHATVYAFEPAPPLFEILHANTAPYGEQVKLFNVGLSNKTTAATFTFYPYSSGMSSFYGDSAEEREILTTIMLNQHKSGMPEMEQVLAYEQELLAERLRSETMTCSLRTLSSVVREHNVARIDLLKIDVQKSEFDVITGIHEADWRKIRQVVLEVHDTNDQLEKIANLLKRHGYAVTVEQDDLYSGSNIYNVYAIRRQMEQQ